MTNEFRAMCAELTTALEAVDNLANFALYQYDWDGRRPKVVQELIDRARALLDQPEPQPVPVSERLPGPEDCDAEGMYWGWWTDPMSEYWEYVGVSAPIEPYGSYIPRAGHTHWLPANALPTPEATND